MGISLRPAHLARYRDIGRLLLRYGGSDVVRRAGLEDAVEEPPNGHGGDRAKATELALDLERLGPTFIKLGQVLSTRHDLLPPEYVEALSRLQDRVEPFPFEQAAQVIASELEMPVSTAFTRIDPKPLRRRRSARCTTRSFAAGTPSKCSGPASASGSTRTSTRSTT